MTDGFDPEFASRGDFVALYRSLGWQSVPALHPHDVREGQSWKRPAIEWRAHENALASDAEAQAWFQSSRARNVGIITGECSGGLWVLDLDLQRNAFAQSFLDVLIAINDGEDFETPTQRTGGGGLQIFFRSFGGRRAPTGKTDVGVDVRGQGGFVVAPPSMHESGRPYEWVEGKEPWRVAAQDAPPFVIDAVECLLREHGHKTNAERVERTGSPETDRDPFGFRVDGREEYMTRLIWARVIDLRRLLDEKPDADESASFCEDAYRTYAGGVKPRLPGPHDEALEREGRGRSAFSERWVAAMAKWDQQVTQEAKATPRETRPKPLPPPAQPGGDDEWDPAQDVFRVLTVEEIANLPDPRWLVDGMLIENAFGLLYGAPGTGKSFVAISLALAIARGGEWWGKAVQRQGLVVYVSSEGTSDMKHRLAAYGLHWQVDVAALPFLLIPDSMSFMEPYDVAKLAATLDRVVRRHGQPVMIVIDTVSRVLPGADENLQRDMTQFIRTCDVLRERYGATVLGVHHSSRAGNLRGSTVFDGAADALFSLERDAEHRHLGNLRAEKVKAAADGWVLPFQLEVVPIDPLKGTQSLVARPRGEGGTQAGGEAQEAPGGAQEASGLTRVTRQTQAQILKAAQEAWEEGNPWSSVAQTRRYGRYAPALMRRWGLAEDEAEALMYRWLDSGLWLYEQADAKSKRHGLRVSTRGRQQAQHAVGDAPVSESGSPFG